MTSPKASSAGSPKRRAAMVEPEPSESERETLEPKKGAGDRKERRQDDEAARAELALFVAAPQESLFHRVSRRAVCGRTARVSVS